MTVSAMGPVLRLTDVTRRFGGLLAVRDVSFDVAHGERRVVLGPNGAGKTTLFNLIAGDLSATSGRIEVFGRDVTALPPHKRSRLGVARTYQRSTLFDGMDVGDNIRLAMIGARGPRAGLNRRSASLLDDRVLKIGSAVGLAEELTAIADPSAPARLPSRLSHGQQRQLELGIALASNPRILLLDEPAAGLSPAERTLLGRLLEGLPRDLTVILIEHDMDVALPFADRVTVMHDGAVVEEGTPDQIVSSKTVHDIYLGSRDA